METLEKNIRSERRYGISFPMRFSLVERSTRKYICSYAGRTSDLSLSGLKFVTKKIPPILWDKIERKQVYLRVAFKNGFTAQEYFEDDVLPLWCANPRFPARQRYAYIGGQFLDETRRVERARIIHSARRLEQAYRGVIIGFLAISLSAGVFAYTRSRSSVQDARVYHAVLSVYQRAQESYKQYTQAQSQYRELTLQMHGAEKTLAGLTRARQQMGKHYQNVLTAIMISSAADMLEPEQARFSRELDALYVLMKEYDQRIASVQREHAAIAMKNASLENVMVKEETAQKILSIQKRRLYASLRQDLYRQIRSLQHPHTGFVRVVRADQKVSTAEQALAAQALTVLGDKDKAEKILAFFRSRFRKELFHEDYSVKGRPVLGSIVSKKATLSVAVASVYFWNHFADQKYRVFAEEIADMFVQGYPRVTFEDHLYAYAFFNMLSTASDKPEYRRVKQEEETVIIGALRQAKTFDPLTAGRYVRLLLILSPEQVRQWGVNYDEAVELLALALSRAVQVSYSDVQILGIHGFGDKGQNISPLLTANMILLFRKLAAENTDIAARKHTLRAEEYLDHYSALFSLESIQRKSPDAMLKEQSDFSLSDMCLLVFAHTGRSPFDADQRKMP